MVLDGEDGRILRRYPAPEGIQLTEPAWIGEDICCLGVDDRGYGIWRMGGEGWSCVLEPSVQQMEDLNAEDGFLEFVSDRNGAQEWYRLDASTGRAWQLTNSRYGGREYARNGDEVWFSSQTTQGMAVFRARLPEPVEVDIRSVHRYPVAEKLSEQEAAFIPSAVEEPVLSAPGRYVKPLHWVKFHSWAPIWFSYDDISSMSVDLSYQVASPGLTGLFQNSLGTTWGSVGYSAYPDAGRAPEWRQAGHLQFTHAGLYPVLQATFDIYDKGGYQYGFQKREHDDHIGFAIVRKSLNQVSWTGRLTAYIPFRFHKDGLQRGFIPQVSWSISNDPFDNGTTRLRAYDDMMKEATHLGLLGINPGENRLMQTFRGSVRGYRMLPVAESRVYPRFGIGAETGVSFRPGLTHIYSPVWYGYLYGYLPGFGKTQGLRLTALGQSQVPTDAPFGENCVQIVPRGFLSADATAIARKSARQVRVTADYAIPVYVGDLSWFSPVAYIKNFLLIPHVDWMAFGGVRNGKGTPDESSLVSAGADFTVELGHFLWAPFPCSVGVSASWLGGPYFKTLSESAEESRKPYSIELIFSLDI